MKNLTVYDVVLAILESYIDASYSQLHEVIIHNNRRLLFFSRKLNSVQQELLRIILSLKEDKGICWGKR